MIRLVTVKSSERVNVILVVWPTSCSRLVVNEYPVLVERPAAYNAVAGSKSSGMLTSVSGIPRSMSISSSMPSSVSPSLSLSSRKYCSFQWSSNIASVFIWYVLPIQVVWIFVVPSAFSVINSPISISIIPMSISIMVYMPSGDIATVVVNEVVDPSESVSLPSVTIPMVSPHTGPSSIRLTKSVTDCFRIVSVKHALLFVAFTS